MSIHEQASSDRVSDLFKKDETILLLASFGAGKSSFINALSHNHEELVGASRSDGKKKYTTTYSSVIHLLGTSAYLVNTASFKGIDSAHDRDVSLLYQDIIQLIKQCKFSDCKHGTEGGCAVKDAITNGDLSAEKYQRFLINNKKMMGFRKYEQGKDYQKNKVKKSKKYVGTNKKIRLDGEIDY